MRVVLQNISGSFELKEEYDRLMREKEGAEQETAFACNCQKGYKSERKQLKEQKDEAARFDARLRDKARLWTEFYLWQLFHIQANMEEVSSTTQNLQEESQEMEEAKFQKSVWYIASACDSFVLGNAGKNYGLQIYIYIFQT